MAASVQGSFDVEPAPGMRLPLSLMTMIVARSGTGKTPAQDRLTSGIKKFEDEMREQFDGDWIQYQSATDAHTAERKAILGLLKEQTKAGKDTAYLRQQLSELDSSAPPMPKLVKIIAKNTTLAGIEDRLSSNWPNILVPRMKQLIFLKIDSRSNSALPTQLGQDHQSPSTPAKRNFLSKSHASPGFFRCSRKPSSDSRKSLAPGSRMRDQRHVCFSPTWNPASISQDHWPINNGAQLNSSTNFVMSTFTQA